jgi:hypothetical protein
MTLTEIINIIDKLKAEVDRFQVVYTTINKDSESSSFIVIQISYKFHDESNN